MKHIFGFLLLMTASAARAQDDARIGVTMGYPSAVGVLWRATDRIALRPEFTWTGSSNDSSSTSPVIGTNVSVTSTSSSQTSWQTGVGLGALFYLRRINDLGVYVTPRLAYSRQSTTTGVSGAANSSTSTGWGWTTSGAFGADYEFGRHFGLFGEIGLSYTASTFTTSSVTTITTGLVGVFTPGAGPIPITTTTTTITLRSDSHTSSLGTRSGAGVIFFF